MCYMMEPVQITYYLAYLNIYLISFHFIASLNL